MWFDDNIPTAAIDVPWTWSTQYKVSGTQSHVEPLASGDHGHYFYFAVNGLVPAQGGLLTNWVLLDPCNPTREIRVQWENNRGVAYPAAYWGENLTDGGAGDSSNLRYMGPLPPVGVWTRLDVPASLLNLTSANITGNAFGLYNGKAWFDRGGKATCSIGAARAPSPFPSTDQVWLDDALPAGATASNWSWDTAQKASGTHSSPVTTSNSFTGATQTITPGVGDKLFAYVLIDPCSPPWEIMLQWYDGSGWEHRAYWGQSNVVSASTQTRIGDRPAWGQWVRLEVAASAVGLENVTISGMAFTVANGRAWFDRAGIAPAGSAALQAPAVQSRRARTWAWIRRVIFRRDAPTPVSMMASAQFAIAPQDAGQTKQRYSLYTPELKLMAETATSTATNPPIAYEYVWMNGEPVAQVETATNTMHWYLNDHLGAPLMTTSSSGAIDWRGEREPYGTRYTRLGGDRHQPLALPGQEVDSAIVDRDYNIFRWYRPTFGRFVQSDPIGSFRAYSYADSDPV